MAQDYYCALADVNALVPQLPFNSSSLPNSQAVETQITSIARLIDANLGAIYVVPVVAGPVSLQILRDLCAWGALGRAQEMRTTGVVPEAHGVKNIWTQKFEEWLEMLVDPSDPFVLPDAPKQSDFIEKFASQVVDSNVLSFPDTDTDDADNLGDSRPSISQSF